MYVTYALRIQRKYSWHIVSEGIGSKKGLHEKGSIELDV